MDLIYLNLWSLLLFLLFGAHEFLRAAGPNRSLGLRGLSILSLVTLLGQLSRNRLGWHVRHLSRLRVPSQPSSLPLHPNDVLEGIY